MWKQITAMCAPHSSGVAGFTSAHARRKKRTNDSRTLAASRRAAISASPNVARSLENRPTSDGTNSFRLTRATGLATVSEP